MTNDINIQINFIKSIYLDKYTETDKTILNSKNRKAKYIVKRLYSFLN